MQQRAVAAARDDRIAPVSRKSSTGLSDLWPAARRRASHRDTVAVEQRLERFRRATNVRLDLVDHDDDAADTHAPSEARRKECGRMTPMITRYVAKNGAGRLGWYYSVSDSQKPAPSKCHVLRDTSHGIREIRPKTSRVMLAPTRSARQECIRHTYGLCYGWFVSSHAATISEVLKSGSWHRAS